MTEVSTFAGNGKYLPKHVHLDLSPYQSQAVLAALCERCERISHNLAVVRNRDIRCDLIRERAAMDLIIASLMVEA
jgi:hypothetical protein